MPHTYKRTLLASLGFADQDRSTPDHDLACEYLSQHAQAMRLVRLFGGVIDGRVSLTGCRHSRSGRPKHCLCRAQAITQDTRLTRIWGALEVPLTKGSGKYTSTVGFLDVSITYSSTTVVTSGEWAEPWKEDHLGKACDPPYRGVVDERFYEDELVIEVKSRIQNLSEVLRQLALYKQHRRPNAWILATPAVLTEPEVALLKRESVSYVHLGEGFARWQADRSNHVGEPALSL